MKNLILDDRLNSIEPYLISNASEILTPALAIYPEMVEENISTTIRLLNRDPNRWRPHVKTSKLAFVMKMLVNRGVLNFKVSTTLELLTACQAGASDVLVAYPLVGAAARRVREIASAYDHVQISTLVENGAQVEEWSGSRIGIFVDVNPGMDRTGIEQDKVGEIIDIAGAIKARGIRFRGVHYYDGQLSKYEAPEREVIAHRGYRQLLKIIAALNAVGFNVEEVITAGTPAFPCTISYPGFADPAFIHRASPGTVIYGDCSSLSQLPLEFGYRIAAVVLTTVVSHPCTGKITCDAGHKTVSADAGTPTCAVLGRPDLIPQKPSEEHLPIEVSTALPRPEIGSLLYLIPRHVCPTVNNFDNALIIKSAEITSIEPVTARGRESPLVLTQA